ncbi:MAG: ATP-binding protein [Sphingobacteriia bacterium]|jgi:signal transduction histidine kinase
MKKSGHQLIVFIIFLLFSVTRLTAQETFVITTDTNASVKLDRKNWLVWNDTLGKTDFKTVSSPAMASNFQLIDTTKEHDFSIKGIWFKLKLKNALNKQVKIGLGAIGNLTDIYFADSTNQWKHLKTGIRYPQQERDGYKLLNMAEITIEPNQEIILFISKHSTYFRLSPIKDITINFIDTYLQKEYGIKNRLLDYSVFEYIILGFLLGMILITSIINLSFYKAIKEKEYLYYCLFLIFIGIQSLLSFSDFFFGMENLFIELIRSFSLALMFYCLMRFVQYFFRTKMYLPKWNKLLNVFSYFILLVFIVQFMLGLTSFNMYWYDRIIDVLGTQLYIFMNLIFITILLILFNKQVKANLKILAMLPLMFLFGPVYSLLQIFALANRYYQIKSPQFVNLLNEWNSFFLLLGILWMILFFSWLLFKRYESIQQKLSEEIIDKERVEKEKEAEKNLLISQQNEQLEIQVNDRTKALQESINDLKATQSQLVQSEKMASLGELTAGIAHEIQNPLNFVNNFSEVNEELLAEMKAAIDSGNMDEAKSLATDAIENQQKILHHGKRADSIVKGMLQHSRSTNGVKEPTDINALADEYLRLAYHGLRAKDKSFNAAMKTDFDQTIGAINIVPQDLGRVILNLITNAFYVVNEKKKSGVENYEPTVSVSTKKSGEKVLISVKDNGNGIPPKILDKIFQPFFTTKPTGQGTGLGLSLSYDIVKAHGGELKVETKEGEGSTFTIQLPL